MSFVYRLISFAIVVSMGVVAFFCIENKSFISIVSASGCDYDVLYCNEDCEVVEICNKDLDAFLNLVDLEIISKVEHCDRIIIEGYSNLLNNYKVINGARVNIQISMCGDKTIVGYPLIKNSF